jgi:hypothetical protein
VAERLAAWLDHRGQPAAGGGQPEVMERLALINNAALLSEVSRGP